MTTPEKPCPAHVKTTHGVRYCEQGPEGHWGTHCGSKHKVDYDRELAAWRDAERTQTNDQKDTAA
jgi:hypothetical protein